MMKKEKMIVLFTLVLTMALSLNLTWSADYPSKAISFLIPFGAGGSADIMGRRWHPGLKKI